MDCTSDAKQVFLKIFLKYYHLILFIFIPDIPQNASTGSYGNTFYQGSVTPPDHPHTRTTLAKVAPLVFYSSYAPASSLISTDQIRKNIKKILEYRNEKRKEKKPWYVTFHVFSACVQGQIPQGYIIIFYALHHLRFPTYILSKIKTSLLKPIKSIHLLKFCNKKPVSKTA